MSKVVAIMSMSLDGYVADLNDGVAEVFDWYFTSGDVEIHTGGGNIALGVGVGLALGAALAAATRKKLKSQPEANEHNARDE